MKSQLEVCGATMATTFGRSGSSPVTRQPNSVSNPRARSLAKALPRRGMLGGRSGKRPTYFLSGL